MIDIENIRSNADTVIAKLKTRGKDYQKEIKAIAALDIKLRNLKTQNQKNEEQSNKNAKAVGVLIKEKKNQAQINKIKSEMALLKTAIINNNAQIGQLENEILQLMLSLPNIPDKTVPLGKNELDNKEVRIWGKIVKKTSMTHWDIAQQLAIIDFNRATKLSGTRFIIYKNKGALLVRALINFMLDYHIKNGYSEIIPPFIINDTSLLGTGQLPKFKEDLFQLTNNQYLIPTAEVPLTNLFQNEVINFAQLPIKMCAYTPCFRSEVGSAGRDTRGIIRLHQFNKVELVQIVAPEKSYETLEQLTNNAEAILQALEIPYRVISLCTGDLGVSAAKTYDLELWLPSQNCYREVSSCSNCEDYQARRIKIRFKNETKTIFPHTLNGSGLAIDRVVAAILENFYDENKQVVNIPSVLQPYMHNLKTI